MRRGHGWRSALLACVFLGVYVLVGCDTRAKDADVGNELLTTEVLDFSMDHLREDELRWRLRGTRIEVMEAGATRVEHPTVTIYDNGVPATVITGDTGTIDQDSYDLEITGSVRAVARDGVLYTEKLLWDDDDGKLVGPEDVEIHRGRSVVYGARMAGQPDLKRVHIEDVRFRVLPEDETVDAHAKELDAD